MDPIIETIEKIKQGQKYSPMNLSDDDPIISTINAIKSRQVQNAVQEQAQNEWSWSDPFSGLAFGTANSASDTLVNGTGFVLGTLGDLWESITPWNGIDYDYRQKLVESGLYKTWEEIENATPYRDSLLTSGAKQVLDWGHSINEALTDYEKQIVGENPSSLYNNFKGAGTGLGFLTAGLATDVLSGIPFLGALVSGGLESISEAGKFLSDANAQGKYTEALPIAENDFLANSVLNSGLNYFSGHLSPITKKIFGSAVRDPLGRFVFNALGQVANETFQEPGQKVIEKAANNALQNGNGFWSNLGENVKDYPGLLWQLAPEVALSTLTTELLLGAGGGYRLATNPSLRQNSVIEGIKNDTNVYSLNKNNPLLEYHPEFTRDDLLQQKNNLIGALNNQYQNLGNDIDFNPQAQQDIQNLNSNIQNIDSKIRNLDNIIQNRNNLIDNQQISENNNDNQNKNNNSNIDADLPDDDNDAQRKHIEDELVNAGRSREEARLASKLTAIGIRKIADWGNIDAQDLFNNLDISYVKDIPIEKYIAKNGNVKVNEVAAQTQFARSNDDILTGRTANIKISDKANVSSFIHENGHYFFELIKETSRLPNTSEEFRNSWKTLADWLNISDIDFNSELSNDEKNRLHDAHEKFATALEKYLREGYTPNPNLKHIFERFKQWLKNIYRSVSEIKYYDHNGVPQPYFLKEDIKIFFDKFFSENKNVSQHNSPIFEQDNIQNSENQNENITQDFKNETINNEQSPNENTQSNEINRPKLDPDRFFRTKNNTQNNDSIPNNDTQNEISNQGLKNNANTVDTNNEQTLNENTQNLQGKNRPKLDPNRFFKTKNKNDNQNNDTVSNKNNQKSITDDDINNLRERLIAHSENQNNSDNTDNRDSDNAKKRDDIINSFLKNAGDNNTATIAGETFSKHDFDASLHVTENSKFKDIVDKINSIEVDKNILSDKSKSKEQISFEQRNSITSAVENSLKNLSTKDLKDFFTEVNFPFDEHIDNETNIAKFAIKILRDLKPRRSDYIRDKLSSPTYKFNNALKKAVNSGNDYDTYNQVIGIDGAKALDKSEGVTTRMDNLKIAKKMTVAGKSPLQIKLATGWERGHDMKKSWKYEILDGDITHTPLKEQKILNDNFYGAYLNEIFDAPELYNAYPSLKNIKVIIVDLPFNDKAFYSPNLNIIGLSDMFAFKNPKDWCLFSHARDPLIHEIQHVIQGIEGFPQGANPEQFEDFLRKTKNIPYFKSRIDRASDERNKIIQKLNNIYSSKKYQETPFLFKGEIDLLKHDLKIYDNDIKNFSNEFKNIMDEWEHKYKGVLSAEDAYFNASGEVEARNVQTRADWSKSERDNNTLQSTEDVPPDKQIDIYNQIVDDNNENQLVFPFVDIFNMEQVKRDIETIRKQYEKTDKWLKAPNGKKSNLNEDMWLTVRTPNFKRWFGDWENDPKNASKVLDENGEPLIVYHGTDKQDFSVFNTEGRGKTKGTGAWFTSSEKVANSYHDSSKNYAVFLNIRKPFSLDAKGRFWHNLDKISIINDNTGKTISKKKNGDIFYNIDDAWDYIENELNDHEHEFYNVLQDDKYGSTDDLVRNVWEGKIDGHKNHDGVIIKNVIDNGSSSGNNTIATDYIIPKNNQIKSTKNKGTFFDVPDIYNQIFNELDKNSNDRVSHWKKITSLFKNIFSKFHDYLQGKVARNPYANSVETKKAHQLPDDNDKFRFQDENIEQRYSEAKKGLKNENIGSRVKNSTVKIINSFRKGDFTQLSDNNDLLFAQEAFRDLQRQKSAAGHKSSMSFVNALKELSPLEIDFFERKRLLDDLMWRKNELPDAELPFGFTDESLQKEYKRFSEQIKEHDWIFQRVSKAIQEEENFMADTNKKMIERAKKLGINLDGVLRNPHYYRHMILEYANLTNKKSKKSSGISNLQNFFDSELNKILNRSYLKKYKGSDLDINANYIEANGEVRAQMLMDIATMDTLIKIKEHYDIAPRIRNFINKSSKSNNQDTFSQNDTASLSDFVPEGYEIYNPAGSGLIFSANSVHENILNSVVNDISEQSGIPVDKLLSEFVDDDEFNQLMILPKEIVDTLKDLSKKRGRGMLGTIGKEITDWWKRSVLYSPTHVFKQNFRNLTGDLDAMVAGNPDSLKYTKRAIKELTDYFYRGKEPTKDLQDYIDKNGGALFIESMREAFTDNALKELKNLKQNFKDNGNILSKTFKTVKDSFKLYNKLVYEPLKKASEYREHWFRYATYLSYLNQMNNNDGNPYTWGASNKDEVLALDDLKDRAYKMSNELLGAYDQISDTGKQLREMAIPFYSWLELNARRYYRLFRNGFRGDNASAFVNQLAMGKATKIPFYAFNAVETMAKISLLTVLVQAFNRFIFPDDDDELPRDVKYRPHITLGKANGRVYYFDRIGALADVADWVSLDSIFLDAKEMINGQQSLGDYMKKVAIAPFSKVINSLNPMIKAPYEFFTGRTLYPDASNPRTIKDKGVYLASVADYETEYKLVMDTLNKFFPSMGAVYPSKSSLSKYFVYSIDPDEAAYFNTIDKVRQFQERVLDKKFDGFATSKRGNVLIRLKTALRLKDTDAIRRLLNEYKQLDGTKQGLKNSMKSMDPLHGLTKEELKRFLKWLTPEDRKSLSKAKKYFNQLTKKYLK